MDRIKDTSSSYMGSAFGKEKEPSVTDGSNFILAFSDLIESSLLPA